MYNENNFQVKLYTLKTFPKKIAKQSSFYIIYKNILNTLTLSCILILISTYFFTIVYNFYYKTKPSIRNH